MTSDTAPEWQMEAFTDDGRDVDAVYDHTKLSAINTCPVWGIIRYTLHRSMSGSARMLAPEAGSAAHDGFAAVRLYQLRYIQCRDDLALFHAERLFGATRAAKLWATSQPGRSHHNNAMNMAVEAVMTSGYFDDPMDKRRTLDNIAESVMFYAQKWDFNRFPVWIRDPADSKSDVGIEIAFSFLVRFTHKNGDDNATPILIRYTGKIDGIHTDPKNNDDVIVHENKTGSRIDDSWLAQWQMSHQITGYSVAGSVFTGAPVHRALVLGLQLPIPRNAHDGLRLETVPRNEDMISSWAVWLMHTHQMHEQFKDAPWKAPQYTHSCNRYFRACSFLALCTAPNDEKELIVKEMTIDEWNPLHEDEKAKD